MKLLCHFNLLVICVLFTSCVKTSTNDFGLLHTSKPYREDFRYVPHLDGGQVDPPSAWGITYTALDSHQPYLSLNGRSKVARLRGEKGILNIRGDNYATLMSGGLVELTSNRFTKIDLSDPDKPVIKVMDENNKDVATRVLRKIN